MTQPIPALPASSAATDYLNRLVVKTQGRIMLIPVTEIDWIEAADNYVILHVGERTHLLRGSMNALGAQLDPARFLRIHRSAIVNAERIREVQPHYNGDAIIVLHDGTALRLSRNRRQEVRNRLPAGALGRSRSVSEATPVERTLQY
jgi:two-component system LytT family response regulator